MTGSWATYCLISGGSYYPLKIYVDILINRTGRSSDGTYGLKHMAHVAPVVNANPTKGVLKDPFSCRERLYSLRRHWIAISDMRRQSGFGWDDSLCTVTASDDTWARYLTVSELPERIRCSPVQSFLILLSQSHPKARMWRDRPWKLYDTYNEVLDGSNATGKNVVAPHGDTPTPPPSQIDPFVTELEDSFDPNTADADDVRVA